MSNAQDWFDSGYPSLRLMTSAEVAERLAFPDCTPGGFVALFLTAFIAWALIRERGRSDLR